LLYGGLALSIRFNHRNSNDFDLFCRSEFDPDQLLNTVPYLRDAGVLQVAQNTLTCLGQQSDLLDRSNSH